MEKGNITASGKRKAGISLVLVILLLIFVLLTRHMLPEEAKEVSRTDFVLNTAVTITIYGEDSHAEAYLQECFAICREYEAICSRTKEDSELAIINRQLKEGVQQFTVSSELANIINAGLSYGKMTKGAFDITIEPVSSQWDFTGEKPVVPSQAAITAALPKVSVENVVLVGRTLVFKEAGMGLDLGGIAKGYIADRIKEYLIEKEVKSAVINLGGNVLCVGERPEGRDFRIGIQLPFGDYQETIAAVSCKDSSIVTSGIYERYFIQEETLYHHILNPKTGYPCENNLVGVTILSPSSVEGDGLSTSCFMLGLEEGMQLINSMEDVYAIFITEDKELHYSKGAEEFLLE